MIPNWVRKVEALNISEIIRLWYLTVWNVIGVLVLLAPRLGCLQCTLELWGVLSELLFRFVRLLFELLLFICLGKQELLTVFLAVLAVVLVMRLQFADICLPAKVITVDEGDDCIVFVRWHMS